MSYTKRQRQILLLMREHDFARFQSETREFHHYTFMEGNRQGVCIVAYQTPEWFLEGRGLIEREDQTLPSTYVLTLKGQMAAQRIVNAQAQR